MERKSKDTAKKKMNAATGKAFFEKENMLMEREVNDMRKGKAKKGMRKNGAAQKTELSVDQAKKEIVDKGKSEEEDSRAKKGKGIKGKADLMKFLVERAKKEIAEKGRPEWEKVDPSTYQTCHICLSTDHWTNFCPKTYALKPGDFVGPWGQACVAVRRCPTQVCPLLTGLQELLKGPFAEVFIPVSSNS